MWWSLRPLPTYAVLWFHLKLFRLEGALNFILLQPLCCGLGAPHQLRLPRAPFNQALGTSDKSRWRKRVMGAAALWSWSQSTGELKVGLGFKDELLIPWDNCFWYLIYRSATTGCYLYSWITTIPLWCLFIAQAILFRVLEKRSCELELRAACMRPFTLGCCCRWPEPVYGFSFRVAAVDEWGRCYLCRVLNY